MNVKGYKRNPYKYKLTNKKVSVYALNSNYKIGADTIRRDYPLHDICDLLRCESLDSDTFEYDGRKYDIWFDTDMMAEDKKRPATFMLKRYLICGGWVITHHDEDGLDFGLTSADIRRLDEYTAENNFCLMSAMAKGHWHND